MQKNISRHLKDTSLPLPIWYQDWLSSQWKSKKLILQEKGYGSISPDGSSEVTWLSLQKIWPKGAPNIQTRDETTKTPEGKNSNTSHDGFRDFQKMSHLTSSTLWSPYLRTDKNWFLNRKCLKTLKTFFLLCLLCFLLLPLLRLT